MRRPDYSWLVRAAEKAGISLVEVTIRAESNGRWGIFGTKGARLSGGYGSREEAEQVLAAIVPNVPLAERN